MTKSSRLSRALASRVILPMSITPCSFARVMETSFSRPFAGLAGASMVVLITVITARSQLKGGFGMVGWETSQRGSGERGGL